MSVALAIISHSGTIVASEGRAIQNGSIISDCFDKTFQILDHNILGAHTGLLSFSGMKVEEHINEILRSEHTDRVSLETLTASLIRPFVERLENIDQKVGSFYITFRYVIL